MCPVADHPVHPMTRRDCLRVQGCHSNNGHKRQDSYLTMGGEWVKDTMSRECQYCLSPDGLVDKACDGCTHRRTA